MVDMPAEAPWTVSIDVKLLLLDYPIERCYTSKVTMLM